MHDAIEEIKTKLLTKYKPSYAYVVEAVPLPRKIKSKRTILISVFYGFLVVVLFIIAKQLNESEGAIGNIFWIYLTFLFLIISFGLWALNYVRYKLLSDIDTILEIVPSPEIIRSEIDKVLQLGYRSIYKTLFILFLSALAAVVGFKLDWGIPVSFQDSILAKLLGAGGGALGGWICGNGFWLAASAMHFSKVFSRINDLKLHPVWPESTVSLKKFSGLMSLYAYLFSIEVTFWLLPYLVLIARLKTGDMNISWPFFIGTYALTFFVLFSPIFYFYPQSKIKKLISRNRTETLLELERDTRNKFKNNLDLFESAYLVNLVAAKESLIIWDSKVSLKRPHFSGAMASYSINILAALTLLAMNAQGNIQPLLDSIKQLFQ